MEQDICKIIRSLTDAERVALLGGSGRGLVKPNLVDKGLMRLHPPRSPYALFPRADYVLTALGEKVRAALSAHG